MGVEWGEEEIVLKPFLETTTFRNLQATGAAVVNLTDDVMLFAQGAISNAQFPAAPATRSEEHTSELQSHSDLVCRLLLEKKKKKKQKHKTTPALKINTR